MQIVEVACNYKSRLYWALEGDYLFVFIMNNKHLGIFITWLRMIVLVHLMKRWSVEKITLLCKLAKLSWDMTRDTFCDENILLLLLYPNSCTSHDVCIITTSLGHGQYGNRQYSNV